MKVLTLTTPNAENGTGCRVTLWVAGCSHHCPGCHNKHTWSYDQGVDILDKEVQEKIFSELEKPYIDGLTLSGGDPLAQTPGSLADLVRFMEIYKARFPNLNTWIYAGDMFEDIVKDPNKLSVLKMCDVLVDGPFIQKKYDPDIAFRGSTNQRIIDIKKSLETGVVHTIDIK